MKNLTQFSVSALLTAVIAAGLIASTSGCAASADGARGPSTAPRDASSAGRPTPARQASLPLGYTKRLTGVSTIDEALARVKAALKAQKFGVITRINVQAVMKKKLGVTMRPYWILGACNPKLAHKALEADKILGLLLPCKVIVYQDNDGSFVVTLARPKTIFTLVSDPRLAPVAAEVDRRFQLVLAAL